MKETDKMKKAALLIRAFKKIFKEWKGK